jgi:hypothetical protein
MRIVTQEVKRTSYTRRVRLFPKRCPVCKEKFEGQSNATYCSPSCRLKADYQRHAEQRKARRRESHRRQKAGQAP